MKEIRKNCYESVEVQYKLLRKLKKECKICKKRLSLGKPKDIYTYCYYNDERFERKILGLAVAEYKKDYISIIVLMSGLSKKDKKALLNDFLSQSSDKKTLIVFEEEVYNYVEKWLKNHKKCWEVIFLPSNS